MTKEQQPAKQKQEHPYYLDDSLGYPWLENQHQATSRISYHSIRSDSCATLSTLLVKLCNKGLLLVYHKGACWLSITLHQDLAVILMDTPGYFYIFIFTYPCYYLFLEPYPY